MVIRKHGFIMLIMILVCSCKQKEQTATIKPDVLDSIAPMNADDIDITHNDSIGINKPNAHAIEKPAEVLFEKFKSEPKQVPSKVTPTAYQKPTNITEPITEKPSIKPVTEQVKEIPSTTTKDIPIESPKDAEVILINHQLFDAQLKKYVNAGKVNYMAWKKDMTGLQKYLDELSASKNIEKWSYEEKLVFWINTYNAFTVKLILDYYPIKSIKDINGGKPWDKRFIQIGSTFYSLNDIENEIIRKKFGEPRIHFALNCAAKSCPILVNKAYTIENLNSLLESNTKNFINGPENTITKDKLEISSIFDWYGSDFDDLISFIGRYSTTKPNPNAKISFKNYNWALNE